MSLKCTPSDILLFFVLHCLCYSYCVCYCNIKIQPIIEMCAGVHWLVLVLDVPELLFNEANQTLVDA